jgi:hypothetical protein
VKRDLRRVFRQQIPEAVASGGDCLRDDSFAWGRFNEDSVVGAVQGGFSDGGYGGDLSLEGKWRSGSVGDYGGDTNLQSDGNMRAPS